MQTSLKEKKRAKPKNFQDKEKPKNHLIEPSKPRKQKHQTDRNSKYPRIIKTPLSKTVKSKTITKHPDGINHNNNNKNEKQKIGWVGGIPIKDPNQRKQTLSLKERGGRMAVPFF